jgi:MFS transporter, DHA3 family, macrolide efflux protein
MNNKLWNRNFSIITIGSIISMMGNSVSNFALGLVVFHHTNSTLLYSLFIILNTIPKIIVPMLVGPFVDRSSRKKIIITIDMIYGFLFIGFAYVTYIGFFNYPFYILLSMILGSLDSIYNVAYESLYPEFIGNGNFSKAYSISSLIYPIANTIMVPIAGFAYEWVGVTPLFLFNGVTFFITQGIERLLEVDERYLVEQRMEKNKTNETSYWDDFKEGINYLKQERGLVAIVAYFFIAMLTTASSQTLLLPHFTSLNKVSWYSLLMSISTAGRIIGGVIHYKFKYPAKHKFKIALFVYITTSIIEGSILFLAYPTMAIVYLCSGILSVTSYNIRISGTQNYLESNKRGRFNGIFMMVTMLGSMIGQFTSGLLGDYFPIPNVIAGFMMVNVIGAIYIMLSNRNAVKKIYNQNL